VTVVLDDGGESEDRARTLQQQWASWDPGVELRVLRTDYASVVEPITSFIDELRAHDDRQIVVLIPVVIRTACAIACSTIRSTRALCGTTDPP